MDAPSVRPDAARGQSPLFVVFHPTSAGTTGPWSPTRPTFVTMRRRGSARSEADRRGKRRSRKARKGSPSTPGAGSQDPEEDGNVLETTLRWATLTGRS